MRTIINYLSMDDGAYLNTAPPRALPSLDANVMLDPQLCDDRQKTLACLVGHITGTPGENTAQI